MLVQAHIAAFLLHCLRYILRLFRIKILKVSLKVNALSCWKHPNTPNPTLNLSNSINKCKSDRKIFCWCSRTILTYIRAVLPNRSFTGFIPELSITHVQCHNAIFRSINRCPLLWVRVHCVCVCVCVCSLLCVCALWWVKCRAQIPSMGHQTWLYVMSLSYCMSYKANQLN